MAEIRPYHSRPAIMVDGKAYPPMMATIRTNNRENLVLDPDYFRELGNAGIRIFFLICDTEWLKPNALALFREEAEMLLSVVPDAYIVPRIGMHPTNEWIKAHPGECITYSDGSSPAVHLFTESYETDLPAHYSLCSSEWRHDAGEALAETWRHLMELPYADRIIGCFLAAGGTSEWYYILPTVKGDLALDHSDAFRRAFSAYLTEKYKTDEALRARWHDPMATLENPPIPEIDAHYYTEEVDCDAAHPKCVMYSNAPVPPPYGNGTNIGSFVDMDKREDVFDFYRAWHNGTADSIIYFADIIKKLTPDRLVGAFYGSWGCTAYLSNGTCGGTLKLLDSPSVDFLAAPGVYENRQPGGYVGQREFYDSFAIRNKIYIIEDDCRTHLENRYFQIQYGLYDLQDSVDVMKREFGRTLCEDVQAWWFDQLLGGKRYKHPALYELIQRQQEIAEEAYSLDRTTASEIALIFDEESAQAVSQQTTMELVEVLHNCEMSRIGAPVDQYYHNDMANPAMPAYKLYIFVNTMMLSDAERTAIREKLKREHAAALWLYGAGVLNPGRTPQFSPDYMQSLTGFPVKALYERFDARFRMENEHPLTEGLDRRYVFGTAARPRYIPIGDSEQKRFESYLYPLFYPDTEAGEKMDVCAHFVTSGVPAMAVKEEDGFVSIFYGAKCICSDILRAAARYAGCHIYSDSDDVLFANRNYLTFHSSSSGRKTVRFPATCSPFEVYEQKSYGENVTEITFDTYLGETKMFRLK